MLELRADTAPESQDAYLGASKGPATCSIHIHACTRAIDFTAVQQDALTAVDHMSPGRSCKESRLTHRPGEPTWSKNVHAASQIREGVVAVLSHKVGAVEVGAEVASRN